MRQRSRRTLAALLALLMVLTLLPSFSLQTAAANAPAAANGDRAQSSSDYVFITQPAQTVHLTRDAVLYSHMGNEFHADAGRYHAQGRESPSAR